MANQTKSDTIKKAQTENSKSLLLDALEKSLGVITTACKTAQIHRSTFYKWYNEDPGFAEAVDDIENIAIDFAESNLHQKIKKGDTAAIIFYLKTKGKKRGYIEKQEFDVSNQGNITIIEAEYKPEESEQEFPELAED